MDDDFDELTELTKLYELQKARIETQIARELRVGELDKDTLRELELSVRILASRFQVRKDLGLVGDRAAGKARAILDLRGYSEETARVLSRPDSRRRVVSIVERIKRMAETDGALELSAGAEPSADDCTAVLHHVPAAAK